MTSLSLNYRVGGGVRWGVIAVDGDGGGNGGAEKRVDLGGLLCGDVNNQLRNIGCEFLLWLSWLRN